MQELAGQLFANLTFMMKTWSIQKTEETKQTYNGIEVIHRLADITKETTDCIVNAANKDLAHGGGVAYAIAKAGGK